MQKIKLTFPDNTVKEVDSGISAQQVIADHIGEGLLRAAIAVQIDNTTMDLTTTVTKDCNFKVLTFKDTEGKEVYWHSSAHIVALAVKRLFPNAKLTIGPAVDNGFYYDFDVENPFTEEDLSKIESEAKKIIKEAIPFQRSEIDYNKAKELAKDEPYKLEMIEDLNNENQKLSFYNLEDWFELCRGPHVTKTSRIKAIKLLRASGAYWRGDSKNKQLQRIYGISFPSKDELKEFVTALEEAKKRDHNVLGRKLDLFITSELVGQGLPLLTPKGAKIKQLLQRWIEDLEEENDYGLTMTPFMAKSDLYKVSGHWDHYKDGMFVLKCEDKDFALRPMTCPFQFQIYNSKLRSYKDLPIRYNETSTLFRNEASGEMHGLIRVRQFTLSEGHIICTPDQLEIEFGKVLELINHIMKTLGFEKDIWYRYSKWDPNNEKGKYIDDPQAWKDTQQKMKKILDSTGIEYTEADGEAAFYGPKLDIQAKNVYGKEDTLFTVQIDFALPKRFNMTYIDENNNEQNPYIIHRSSIGCYERTMAMLIEKYAGNLPLWLNPTQVILLPIADRHIDYCKDIAQQMKKKGIRTEINDKSETMNKKVRNAQLEKINYIVVVGDKEQENKTVNVRTRNEEILGEKSIDAFITELKTEIDSKEIK